MTSVGVVRAFDAEQGVGVIDSPDTPDGCWVHFSAIAMKGYASLVARQAVEFAWEAVGQDGYDCRAVRVWPAGETPYDEPPAHEGPSGAYHSRLTIEMHGDAPRSDDP